MCSSYHFHNLPLSRTTVSAGEETEDECSQGTGIVGKTTIKSFCSSESRFPSCGAIIDVKRILKGCHGTSTHNTHFNLLFSRGKKILEELTRFLTGFEIPALFPLLRSRREKGGIFKSRKKMFFTLAILKIIPCTEKS